MNTHLGESRISYDDEFIKDVFKHVKFIEFKSYFHWWITILKSICSASNQIRNLFLRNFKMPQPLKKKIFKVWQTFKFSHMGSAEWVALCRGDVLFQKTPHYASRPSSFPFYWKDFHFVSKIILESKIILYKHLRNILTCKLLSVSE